MSKQLYKAGFESGEKKSNDSLYISELFYDTIQGEGKYVGIPSIFIRLCKCTLECLWCDSLEVWRHGQYVSFQTIFSDFEKSGIIERLKNGHHLILTGGSPLMQQYKIISFIRQFIYKYGFKPFIEIENEVVLIPNKEMFQLVDHWNNSPKLKNSQNDDRKPYRPKVIEAFKHISINNTILSPISWKFVIEKESDWDEIKRDYLDTNLIKRSDIILMPCGATRDELSKTREIVVEIAIRENVRFSEREHVVIWDKKTGV